MADCHTSAEQFEGVMETYLSMAATSVMLERAKGCLQVEEISHRGDIQPLWSGFGVLSRLFVPQMQQTVIVKYIMPPDEFHHPRGWNNDTSQNRKRRSYEVEQAFYRDYAVALPSACRVPLLIASYQDSDYQMMVLEDLDAKGYDQRTTKLSFAQVTAGVSWLARFHGYMLGRTANGLWEIGCYWHLATRQDEWRAMSPGPLKTFADAIDRKLSSARFTTLVHGDAKAANLCLHHSDDAIAVVDFQYAGAGVGVKDLGYFLGSCLTSDELFQWESRLLDLYFDVLARTIRRCSPQTDVKALELEWRQLYPFAWADFHRFLAGWAPDHGKINPYMQAMSEEALASL